MRMVTKGDTRGSGQCLRTCSLRFACALGVLVLLTSCDELLQSQNRKADASNTSSAANDDINAMKRRLNALEFQMRMLHNKNQTAYLGPEDKGFDVVETANGRFFVSLTGMSPYGDGYKLHINLGNPQHATYPDVVVKARWGKRDEYGFAENEDGMKSVSVTLTRNLRPGSWNPIEVVVAPASRLEVGAVYIDIETPSLILARY